MLYLDTSVLVAAFTPESVTHAVQAWLGAQDPAELAISDWLATEFSSALSIKTRSGQP
ncbi:MAG: type II toxin-antitoxin system VapC family toxin [Nocardioidaceae bacterium]